jgi:hypothetical protein
MSYIKIKNFYIHYCKQNADFLENYKNIKDDFDYSSNKIVLNEDMIESINQYNELSTLYNKNNLVAFRPGCVETSFVLYYKYNFKVKNSHLYEKILEYDLIDIYMKENTGLYYKDNKRRKEVLDWWVNNYIELMKKCTLCSCYCFLQYDIPMSAIINKKGYFYNYSHLYKIILEHSENKKILYVGYNIDSIKKGYERGLQNVWKFKVSNFDMYYLKTPQTTLGMEYPHDSMIETTNQLIFEIENNFPDFDTAIFGCGAYGSSLINILSEKYYNKNLIYLGSDCLKMFGIKINLQSWEEVDINVIKENVIDIVETLPNGCKNHPEKKYWKI